MNFIGGFVLLTFLVKTAEVDTLSEVLTDLELSIFKDTLENTYAIENGNQTLMAMYQNTFSDRDRFKLRLMVSVQSQTGMKKWLEKTCNVTVWTCSQTVSHELRRLQR